MGMVNLFMLMVMYIKANGKMIKQMAMEFILIVTGLNIKDIGKMIYNAVMVNNHG